ncbi:allantoate amidohydrolase [Bacillus sp. 165]|uniref:allantoate amidohydrolase n=1 Tax=Bacillus sp. 165 TaxID=1529117 RepID=UPI001ADC59D6|nr:allantoate amidohydrolase [Bacillus sp. 165]MBO9129263.1 allantoate amidohydrolase [Bacillus sp. 165]
MQALHQKVNMNRIIEHIEQLALCSRTTRGVTRFSFTKEMEAAYDLIYKWMLDAGMTVRRDEINNIIGRYEGTQSDAPVLLIGSHLDSVLEGGKYDGALGVLAGIEVVQTLFENNIRPKHPIEVIGFCDEEGARFHTTFLGSKALAGTLQEQDLQAKDEAGITIAEAMTEIGLNPAHYTLTARDPNTVYGYIELHIEQGPVLEQQDQACGVVLGIVGTARYEFRIEGLTNHAGTVPMNIRKDALTGAAEMIQAIETIVLQYESVVATVGKLSIFPGVSNVIPGIVEGTLDIRSINDEKKVAALHQIIQTCHSICHRRGLRCEFTTIMESGATVCSKRFIPMIESALMSHGMKPIHMISGAGHDAMTIADLTKMGMIFVRCKEGLSHHPDEYVAPEDIKAGVFVLLDVTLQLAL